MGQKPNDYVQRFHQILISLKVIASSDGSLGGDGTLNMKHSFRMVNSYKIKVFYNHQGCDDILRGVISDKGTLVFSFIVFRFSALQTERDTFLWFISCPTGIFLDKTKY